MGGSCYGELLGSFQHQRLRKTGEENHRYDHDHYTCIGKVRLMEVSSITPSEPDPTGIFLRNGFSQSGESSTGDLAYDHWPFRGVYARAPSV